MKYFIYLICTTALLTACGNSDNSTTEKDLELREKELELKESELALQQSQNNSNSDMSSNDRSVQTNQSTPNRNTYNPQPSTPREKSAEELREELYRKEMKNPKEYLSVTYDLTYKVLSGEDKITGNIYNYASMATFKDVVLTVTYSTATGTYLGSEEFVKYDYVYPGSSVPFLIKVYSPDGTKQIGVKIKSAIAE